MNAVLIALSVLCATETAGQQKGEPPSLVVEGARHSVADGIHELEPGRGWLRIDRLFLDFRLTLDFRAMTPDLDAGVMVRTWTGRGGWPDRGFRIRLPTDAAARASSVLMGHREAVSVIQEGTIALRPGDDWQKLQIEGEGRRITVMLNDTLVGVFGVERFGGHVLFDNKVGRVQLKNVRIASMERDPKFPSNLMPFEQLKKAGGQPPRLVHEVRPNYTREAMERRVEGRVDLEMEIRADGSVGAVRVTRSLDQDLDIAAIAAVREWTFRPGLLNGKGVPVLAEVEMTFHR
jgi:TonB family protein